MIDKEYIYINDNKNRHKNIEQDLIQLVLSDESLTEETDFIDIVFENCLIEDLRILSSRVFKLSEILYFNITFINCKIIDLKAENLNIKNLVLDFKDCSFIQIEISELNTLKFLNTSCYKATFLNINNVRIEKSLSIISTYIFIVINKIEIFDSKIYDLAITHNSYNESGFLKINKSEIKFLTLEGEYKNIFSVENSKIDQFILEYCSFAKNALFYNIQPINPNSTNSYARLVCSNLNNVIFDNFFFNQYEKILLFRNSFENVKFIGCDFPESLKEFDKILTVEDINNPDKKNVNYSKVRYETFLQLKNALEKSGNYYEANKLKAASDEALKNIENLPVWDKIILCLNNFTNLHGQSFGRTLSVFIFSTIFLYFLYLKSLGVYMQIFTEFDIYLVKNYFAFIDITHKSDFLNPKGYLPYENTLLSLFIDYTSKIWMAYLIYQFIAAFRKYAKK